MGHSAQGEDSYLFVHRELGEVIDFLKLQCTLEPVHQNLTLVRDDKDVRVLSHAIQNLKQFACRRIIQRTVEDFIQNQEVRSGRVLKTSDFPPGKQKRQINFLLFTLRKRRIGEVCLLYTSPSPRD